MKTSIFRIPKPILIFMLIGVIFLFGFYVVFQSNYVAQRLWQVLTQIDHTHVFMIDVMEAYTEEELPFEKDGLAYQFIEKILVSYAEFVTTTDDPFGDKEVQFDDVTTKRLKQLYEQRYPQWSTNQTEGEQHSANPAPK